MHLASWSAFNNSVTVILKNKIIIRIIWQFAEPFVSGTYGLELRDSFVRGCGIPGYLADSHRMLILFLNATRDMQRSFSSSVGFII